MFRFNPLKYGFKQINDVPILGSFCSKNSFVKIVAIGEKGLFNRLVFWYMTARPLGHDDRWEISGGSYDSKKPHNEQYNLEREYIGCITNEVFADELMKHLLGAVIAGHVDKIGKERMAETLEIVL